MRSGVGAVMRTRAGGLAGAVFATILCTVALIGGPSAAVASDDAQCVVDKTYCGAVNVTLTGVFNYGAGRWYTVTSNGGFTPDGRVDCAIQFGVQTGTCNAKFYLGALPSITAYWRAEANDDSKVDASGSLVVEVRKTTQATYKFDLVDPQLVIVSKSGSGAGTVTSAPPKVNCGNSCQFAWARGTDVMLTATPASGSTFGHWTGSFCNMSTATNCSFVADVFSAVNIDAYFVTVATPPVQTASPKPSKTPTPATPRPSRTPAVTAGASAAATAAASGLPVGTGAAASASAAPLGSGDASAPIPTAVSGTAAPGGPTPSAVTPTPSFDPASSGDGNDRTLPTVLAIGVAILAFALGLFWVLRLSRRAT